MAHKKKKGRCWRGYHPVKGKPAYSKGSCKKNYQEVKLKF